MTHYTGCAYLKSLCLLSHTIVQVLPPDPIRSEQAGADAIFNCVLTGRRAFGIHWVINGTLFQNHTIEGVTEYLVELANHLMGILVFSNLPIQYSMTTIQCKARIFSGATFLSVNNVTLLVTPGIYTITLYNLAIIVILFII